jgi:hypothetical protein
MAVASCLAACVCLPGACRFVHGAWAVNALAGCLLLDGRRIEPLRLSACYLGHYVTSHVSSTDGELP